MKIIVPIILAMMFLAGCSQEVNELSYKQISTEAAVEMMADETNYIIIDARTPEEYAKGHIENSINIPNEIIGDREIEKLPDKNQLIMIYCRSGNRSKQAANKLVKLGYTNIVEFGGINTWTGELVIE